MRRTSYQMHNMNIMQKKCNKFGFKVCFAYICTCICGYSSVVEHRLPKPRAAGSTPVTRSDFLDYHPLRIFSAIIPISLVRASILAHAICGENLIRSGCFMLR